MSEPNNQNLVPTGHRELAPVFAANPLVARGIADLVTIHSTVPAPAERDREVAHTVKRKLDLAVRLHFTRRRFRRKVLECDYAMRQVVETLKGVHWGDLSFDRTIKVAIANDDLERDKVLARLPHNLRTIEPLMEANVEDFQRLGSDWTTAREKLEIRERLRLRRRKMATLVEELSIRTQKVQPLMKKLEQIIHFREPRSRDTSLGFSMLLSLQQLSGLE